MFMSVYLTLYFAGANSALVGIPLTNDLGENSQ